MGVRKSAGRRSAEAGANVVMLEAGPTWDNTTDSAIFKWAYESPRRGAATPERQFGEVGANLGGWSLHGEPYTQAPGTQFDWFRSSYTTDSSHPACHGIVLISGRTPRTPRDAQGPA